MPVRAGASNLIRRLRGLCQIGTADYTVNGVAWWSDDAVQEILDANVMDYHQGYLRPQIETDTGGTARYFNYYAPQGNLEEAVSGTVYWRVFDSIGSVVGTANYTVNYVQGYIRFNADTGGTAYYLRARGYDLNSAAAQIWREKAGSSAAFFSFSSDNQSFSRGQWFDHCESMAEKYEAQTGGVFSKFQRDDLMPSGADY